VTFASGSDNIEIKGFEYVIFVARDDDNDPIEVEEGSIMKIYKRKVSIRTKSSISARSRDNSEKIVLQGTYEALNKVKDNYLLVVPSQKE